MKKPRQNQKSLQLSLNTVRQLSKQETGLVAGGNTDPAAVVMRATDGCYSFFC